MKNFDRAVIQLSCLLIIFAEAVFVSCSKDLFGVIREPDIKPYRIDNEVSNIGTIIDCMVACRSTTNCVGGRVLFEQSNCQMTIHESRIMSYRKDTSASEKDFVFGLPCSSSYGYDTQAHAYIKGHNDITINGVTDINVCRKECSRLVWCRSVDVNPFGCYLAGVYKSYVTVSNHSDANYISAAKKCWA